MTPKVSVCTITYNHAPYIAQCLQSAVEQDLPFPHEVIVGDDASTDGTADVVADFARRYPSIVRPILRPTNIGGSRNFIDVVSQARGDYVALLDGDDYWTDRRKLAKQVGFLDAHPDFAHCFTNAEMLTIETGAREPFCKPGMPEEPTLGDVFSRGTFVPPTSYVFRRAGFELPAWWTEISLSLTVGDWTLLAVNFERGRMRYLDEVCGVYRVHRGGEWGQRPVLRRVSTIVRIYEAFLERYGDRHGAVIRERLAYHRAQRAALHVVDGEYENAARALREWSAGFDPRLGWRDRLALARIGFSGFAQPIRLFTSGKVPDRLRAPVRRWLRGGLDTARAS